MTMTQTNTRAWQLKIGDRFRFVVDGHAGPRCLVVKTPKGLTGTWYQAVSATGERWMWRFTDPMSPVVRITD